MDEYDPAEEIALDRIEKALLSIMGSMEGLVEKGLIARSDDAARLTPDGMKAFRELEASGFAPTAGELQMAVAWFKHPNPPEEKDAS